MSVEDARYWLSWLEFGSKLAIILVVIGVGYEFVEKRFGAPLQKIVDDAHEAQITRLQSDAATAQARTMEAAKQIEELRKETAEANARAAQATLELQKLRQKLAPRSLNDRQRDGLIKFFRLVASGAKVNICSCSGTSEVVGFTTQIKQLLVDSGWKVTLEPWLRSDRIVVGVLIESDPEDLASVNIADGFWQRLRMEGVMIVHEYMRQQRGKFDEPIRITIGTQPL